MKKLNLISMIHGVTSVIFYLLIVALLIFSVANIDLNKSNDVAHVMGMGFLSAEKDSMDEIFAEGDVVFIKLIDENNQNELVIGNIVTYYDTAIREFKTHQIINIYTENGQTYIQTQKDPTLPADNPIVISEVIGIYQSSVVGIGHSLDYLQTPEGFLLFIILPVGVLLIYEGIILFRNLLNYNKIKFEARFEIRYKKMLKNLEQETLHIREKVLANWIHDEHHKF